MPAPDKAPGGPTAAEKAMLYAYDVFEHLLNCRPAEARRLAEQVSQLAVRYDMPPQNRKANDNH